MHPRLSALVQRTAAARLLRPITSQPPLHPTRWAMRLPVCSGPHSLAQRRRSASKVPTQAMILVRLRPRCRSRTMCGLTLQAQIARGGRYAGAGRGTSTCPTCLLPSLVPLCGARWYGCAPLPTAPSVPRVLRQDAPGGRLRLGLPDRAGLRHTRSH